MGFRKVCNERETESSTVEVVFFLKFSVKMACKRSEPSKKSESFWERIELDDFEFQFVLRTGNRFNQKSITIDDEISLIIIRL